MDRQTMLNFLWNKNYGYMDIQEISYLMYNFENEFFDWKLCIDERWEEYIIALITVKHNWKEYDIVLDSNCKSRFENNDEFIDYMIDLNERWDLILKDFNS